MNPTETVNILTKVQEEFPVKNIRYRNYPVWPILRYMLAHSLLVPREKNEFDAEHDLPPDLNKEGKSFDFLKDLFFLAKIGPGFLKLENEKTKEIKKIQEQLMANVFVSAVDEPYPDKINDKKYSRYLDPYIEFISQSNDCVKIQLVREATNTGDYFISTHFLNEKKLIPFFLIKERLDQSFKNNKEDLSFYKMLQELNLFFKKHAVPFYFQRWILDDVKETLRYVKLFEEVFNNTKVKTVFIECYYSKPLFGLCLACHSLGIRVVDIQHGVVDINYLAWKNVPTEYKASLPDFYWVWSEKDKETTRENNTGKYLQPVLGGNLWLAKYINKSVGSTTVVKSVSGKIILVSLQYGTALLNQLLSIVIPAIKNDQQDNFWQLRFHPLNTTEDRALVHEAFTGMKNVDYTKCAELNLFDVLQSADLHVVGSSAVALEGMQFNLPTIIIHPFGKDVFSELIDGGIFSYAENAADLLEKIKTFTPTPSSAKYKIEVSDAIAKNCLSTILN